MEFVGEKELKIGKFYNFVLRYLALHGEEKLTASVIARGIGVSRPWIYKYFGSEKRGWLKIAAEGVGQLLTTDAEFPQGTSHDEANEFWKKNAKRLLKIFEDRPWIGRMYFRYMGRSDHPIGQAIQRLEDAFLEKSSRNFSKVWSLKPRQARTAAVAFAYYRMVMAHVWVEKGPEQLRCSREVWVKLMVPKPQLEE